MTRIVQYNIQGMECISSTDFERGLVYLQEA